MRKRSPLAGYIRVSHVGGRKRLHSPNDQAVEMAGWAKAHNREVVMLPPELEGKGDNANRPIFRHAVDGVKSGEFSGVLVAYLSRAGRDLRLMLDLWDEVETAGGVVYSARENIDGSTPSGRLHRNLLASIAQHELEERREGFAHARRHAVMEDKIHVTGRVPLGYRRREDKILEPDPATASIVRDMFRRRAAGESWSVIARAVSEALGRPIAPQSIARMVRNRVYLGEARSGDYVNPDAHAPLGDRATFEAAQLAHPRPPRGKRGAALLQGVIRCAGCGRLMVPTTRSGGVRAYRCRRHHQRGECPEPCHVGQWIEAHVETVMSKLMKGRGYKATQVNRRLRTAERELEAAEAARDDFAVATAGMSREDIAAGMKAHAETVRRTRRTFAEARAAAVPVPDVRTWGQAWEKLSVEQRRHVLRSGLSAVVVRKGRGVDPGRVRILEPGAVVAEDERVDFDRLEGVIVVP